MLKNFYLNKNMAWKCVQKKCSTRNTSPNIKHGFVNITSFSINLWKDYEHTKPMLKRKVEVKFKDGTCAKLCLKLLLESNRYFRDKIEPGWFWKWLSRNKVPNNHLLKSVWKGNCPEVHRGTLDSYFQSND